MLDVGLAGLELGIVNDEDEVFSGGEFYLPNVSRPYRDWKKGGHGSVNIYEALEQSVNSYFYQLALDLGIDRMHDYLAPYGFGAPTGIEIPGEVGGTLRRPDHWSAQSPASLAIWRTSWNSGKPLSVWSMARGPGRRPPARPVIRYLIESAVRASKKDSLHLVRSCASNTTGSCARK